MGCLEGFPAGGEHIGPEEAEAGPANRGANDNAGGEDERVAEDC
jgi:hypothetical protein